MWLKVLDWIGLTNLTDEDVRWYYVSRGDERRARGVRAESGGVGKDYRRHPPTGTKLADVLNFARISGLTDEEIRQVWRQGMVLRSAGVRVYSPEQVGQRIMSLDDEFGIHKMWLVLYKPADLDSPFYEITRRLIEKGVRITYLVPENAIEVISHLRKKLKRDKKLKIDPKDVDERVLEQVVDEERLAKNIVFVTAGKGAMEQRLGFECIRDNDGRTYLIYDMPPGERKRLWPATKPRILRFAKDKEVG